VAQVSAAEGAEGAAVKYGMNTMSSFGREQMPELLLLLLLLLLHCSSSSTEKLLAAAGSPQALLWQAKAAQQKPNMLSNRTLVVCRELCSARNLPA
jgi:hypothetical protein